MNKQFKVGNGARVRSGIEWTDYTWNPIAGCFHDCRWTMPDGKVAACYAEAVAEGLARKAYPDGFKRHYWRPGKLGEPLKVDEPSKIFAVSMGDLFGRWVDDYEIEQVLNICRRADQHTFQLLTKNAPRANQFTFPDNVWLGVSSPPDFMWGKPLSRSQQKRMLRRSLTRLDETGASVRWMSFEPLSWDVASIVAAYPGVLQWAVIGAASKGRVFYPPEEAHLRALLEVLDAQGVRVFFKGNLKSLDWAAEHWREEWPEVAA